MEFFSSLYTWFGLWPFFSSDMDNFLQGHYVDSCDDKEQGPPLYLYVGIGMLLLIILLYIVQYHWIDKPNLNKKKHWWMFAFLLSFLNFCIAFLLTFNAIQDGNYCTQQLNLSNTDAIGFGLSNAIWSFLLFTLITSIPYFRQFSINSKNTTFWKP